MTIPNWLRWLIFLPSALVVLGVTYTVIIWLNTFFYIGFKLPYIEHLSIIMAAGGSAYCYVWCGARIAPIHQFEVALFLTVIYILLAIIVLFFKFHMGSNSSVSWFEIFAFAIPGIIVAMDRSPDTGAMMAFVVFNGSDRIEEHQLRALTLVDPGAVSDRAQRVETNVVLGLT